MLENFLRDRATIERLRGCLFGPHLDSFIATFALYRVMPVKPCKSGCGS
jgi:hypothetical protein